MRKKEMAKLLDERMNLLINYQRSIDKLEESYLRAKQRCEMLEDENESLREQVRRLTDKVFTFTYSTEPFEIPVAAVGVASELASTGVNELDKKINTTIKKGYA